MSIMPIEGVMPTTAVSGLQDLRATSGVGGAAESGGGFGTALANGLEQVQALHGTADDLSIQAATGDLQDVHDYMIASQQASTATSLTVAVRNKALEAFSEIMRMTI